MPAPRTVCLAGSTGSIGTQALEVIAACGGQFEVASLGACSSVAVLAEQARRWRPGRVAIADATKAAELAALVPPGTEVIAGDGALAAIAEDADIVVNGVVGFAGLEVTLAALSSGRRLALANKESLIAGRPSSRGPGGRAAQSWSRSTPEHCAVHQCLRNVGALAEAANGDRGGEGTMERRRCVASS